MICESVFIPARWNLETSGLTADKFKNNQSFNVCKKMAIKVEQKIFSQVLP